MYGPLMSAVRAAGSGSAQNIKRFIFTSSHTPRPPTTPRVLRVTSVSSGPLASAAFRVSRQDFSNSKRIQTHSSNHSQILNPSDFPSVRQKLNSIKSSSLNSKPLAAVGSRVGSADHKR